MDIKALFRKIMGRTPTKPTGQKIRGRTPTKPTGAYQWKHPHCSTRSRLRYLKQAAMGRRDPNEFLNVDHFNAAVSLFWRILRKG